MHVNNLPAYCGSFPGPGTSICIPETCPVHTVSPLDTCKKIANAKGGPLGTVATTTASTTFAPVPTKM